MSIPTEGPNPLRPYYIPPSVGSPSNTAQNISSAANASHKYASSRTATTSFGSSARNILADMDYSDYLSDSSPSPGGVMRVFLEQALWRYMSLFLAQPFDVAKMILQVRLASNGQKSWEQAPIVDNSRRRSRKYKNESYEVRPGKFLKTCNSNISPWLDIFR